MTAVERADMELRITPRDIVNHEFTLVKFQEGKQQHETDVLLDTIANALKERQYSLSASEYGHVTGDWIREQYELIPVSQFTDAYNQEQVKAYTMMLADAFDAYQIEAGEDVLEMDAAIAEDIRQDRLEYAEQFRKDYQDRVERERREAERLAGLPSLPTPVNLPSSATPAPVVELEEKPEWMYNDVDPMDGATALEVAELLRHIRDEGDDLLPMVVELPDGRIRPVVLMKKRKWDTGEVICLTVS